MSEEKGAVAYLKDKEAFYQEAFSRNIGLLSKEEQEKLRRCSTAICGMGGVGGIHLITLARLGIGAFHIADGDCFEICNLQRQYGAKIEHLGKNKAEVMKQEALAINPHLEIKAFCGDISPKNIDEFLSGADIVIDGIDFFCIEDKRFLFRKAKERGLFVLTAGPVGFSAALLIFSPTGVSFDDYFDIHDGMSELEKVIAFGAGLAPAATHWKYLKVDSLNLAERKGPSFAGACNLCGALAATEVLKILLKRQKPKAAPFYFQFDAYTQEYRKGYLIFGNRNPIQKLKRWYLLKESLAKSKSLQE